jgi:hypothetical protein
MLKVLISLTVAIQVLLNPVEPPEIWATPIPLFSENHSYDYSLPASKYGAGHRGIDLFVQTNQELTAPFDSVVSFVGKVVDRNLITLSSLTGYKASFEPVCSDLVVGDFVSEGEVFGWQCDADDDYEDHCKNCVHFSVRSEYGYLNPLLFVGRLWPSVLIS